MAATDEIVDIALEIRPDKSTLVPEKRQEVTTEGGLDVVGNEKKIANAIKKLNSGDIPVTLFVEANSEQIKCSKQVGAEAVELHTGAYAEAKTEDEQEKELAKLIKGAQEALDLGLIVHAGHGLTYRNVRPVAQIEGMDELNIGHTIISRAVLVGLDQAVREMLALIK